MEDIPILTDEQKNFFELNGFLIVEDALPPEFVDRINQCLEAVGAKIREERGAGPNDKIDQRNMVGTNFETIIPLVDWHCTVPLVCQLLNSNIHIITSHFIEVPPAPHEKKRDQLPTGFHRDGGTSVRDLKEPFPQMFIKIGYSLSDQSESDSGGLQVVPGSHRLIGPPPSLNGGSVPHGAIEVRIKPGSAVFFENRMVHGSLPNFSDKPRRSLYMGYGYRWVRPMDYAQMPPEILDKCNPVQRQLLSDESYDFGHYIPKDEDVPIRALIEEAKAKGAAA
tara:strand:- start:655 stop:1494 length:840 start_codon:yes stop_codon:yes gene_type:complete